MSLYNRRPSAPVDAEKFVDAKYPPRGVEIDWLHGIHPTAYVTTLQGQRVPVGIGEWIIKEASGPGYYPMADSEFERLYEPVVPSGSCDYGAAKAIAAANEMKRIPDKVRQHINWIAIYCSFATGANWRDILDRIEVQIRRAQRDAETAEPASEAVADDHLGPEHQAKAAGR